MTQTNNNITTLTIALDFANSGNNPFTPLILGFNPSSISCTRNIVDTTLYTLRANSADIYIFTSFLRLLVSKSQNWQYDAEFYNLRMSVNGSEHLESLYAPKK
jgi:hypothetical protein